MRDRDECERVSLRYHDLYTTQSGNKRGVSMLAGRALNVWWRIWTEYFDPIEKPGLERVTPNDEIKHVRYGKCHLTYRGVSLDRDFSPA